MCGIRCIVVEQEGNVDEDVPEWLVRRGPDHVGTDVRLLDTTNLPRRRVLTLQASVMQMRQMLVPQPVSIRWEQNSLCLAWNGEVYQRTTQTADANSNDSNANHTDSSRQQQLEDVWSFQQSDARLVALAIQEALQQQQQQQTCTATDNEAPETVLLQVLTRVLSTLINAEFALCLVTDTAVYYARDGLGRRSLLVFCPSQNKKPSNAIWELASVACHTKGGSWKEVEPGHVYCYNWRNGTTTSLSLSSFALCGLFVPESMEEASRHLQNLLAQAVERRLGDRHEQPCAILFSGGLDSVIIAALALEILPWDHSIHLVNVSFVDQYQCQPTHKLPWRHFNNSRNSIHSIAIYNW